MCSSGCILCNLCRHRIAKCVDNRCTRSQPKSLDNLTCLLYALVIPVLQVCKLCVRHRSTSSLVHGVSQEPVAELRLILCQLTTKQIALCSTLTHRIECNVYSCIDELGVHLWVAGILLQHECVTRAECLGIAAEPLWDAVLLDQAERLVHTHTVCDYSLDVCKHVLEELSYTLWECALYLLLVEHVTTELLSHLLLQCQQSSLCISEL